LLDELIEGLRRIAADPEAGASGEWARELLAAADAEQADQVHELPAPAAESEESPDWGRPRKPR
jgi:hypothetical protein